MAQETEPVNMAGVIRIDEKPIQQHCLNCLSLVKCRLEIKKLRRDLKEKGATRVSIATLDETAQFAKEQPNPHEARRFIHRIRSHAKGHALLIELPSNALQVHQLALDCLDLYTLFVHQEVALLCLFIAAKSAIGLALSLV